MKSEVKLLPKTTPPPLVTKRIADIFQMVEKTHGRGAVMQMNNGYTSSQNVIATGSLLLNQAVGIGGYPLGRIIEIYGPESSGKTTLALHAIAETQKQQRQAVFIDVEHALDPNYAANIGVNLDELIVSQPNSGEEAMDILETLIKTKKVNTIVVDSVAALAPRAELEGKAQDLVIGAQARLMSKTLRKIRSIAYQNNCLIIFINQIRLKIGIVFGNPETTPGGRALRFYASLRLEVRRVEVLTNQNQAYANRVRIKVIKNKMATPFRSALTEIHYGQGIDKLSELLDLGLHYGLIQRHGTWYSYQNHQIAQGKQKTKIFFRDHPTLLHNLTTAVQAKLND